MVEFIIYPIAVTVSFDFRFLPNFSRHQSFSVYDVSIWVLSHVLVSRWTLRNKKCMRERAYSIPEYGPPKRGTFFYA